MSQPHLWLIAGANGVGKTTYAFKTVPALTGSVHFINLDEIAKGLAPLAPQTARMRAGRVAFGAIEEMIVERQSFSLETTLAGAAQHQVIANAKNAGYQTHLLFFFVDHVEICLERIKRRVAEGGHFVPEADARRRFVRGLKNLPLYAYSTDDWRIFDADSPNPKIIAEGQGKEIRFSRPSDTMPEAIKSFLKVNS
jgi:predicted ABC-type ATPase